MEGLPLPVTLRLTQGIMTPAPKMTQGSNDPLTPLDRLSTASLSGVVRCLHSNAYFSLLFFDFHRTNYSRMLLKGDEGGLGDIILVELIRRAAGTG
jgi:hypothetical protein